MTKDAIIPCDGTSEDVSNRGSLRSWRDFALECYCFGSEAVRGLVKSRVEFVLCRRSPAHEYRQLRQLRSRRSAKVEAMNALFTSCSFRILSIFLTG